MACRVQRHDPRLGIEVGAFLDEPALRRWLETYQRRFAAFVDRLGDRLSEERRRIYECVLGAPVSQNWHKLGPWIWWSHLERIMEAFADLGCDELLE